VIVSPLLGTVIAIQANFYRVQLSADRSGLPVVLLCNSRMLLAKMGVKIMVGDRAIVVEPDWANQKGTISEILPRTQEFDRPPVSNADSILLVFAVAEPTLDPYLLSKFLVKAESSGAAVNICLNKSDLVTTAELERWQTRLSDWGYNSYPISIKTGDGVDRLKAHLTDRITILAGHSGVGKSSLTNALIPDLNLRVANVSGKLQRGRHTTRHVELFALPDGGWIADTPGFNQPDLNCDRAELAGCFPEIRHRLHLDRCQFSDCSHRDEPNCVVRGEWERYPDYLDFLAQAIEYTDRLQSQPNPESNFKTKQRGKTTAIEPKLAPKKYRQISRRWQHQDLQMDGDDESNDF
jgi:ribosome biogenesis GTPase / thiamine phosphate phosphatase